jgi:hypothetical protein
MAATDKDRERARRVIVFLGIASAIGSILTTVALWVIAGAIIWSLFQ